MTSFLTFPDHLPVSQQRDTIAQAIRSHPIVIVCGETGSGKTTQLPKICLSIGRGEHGLIGHTQPRRVAATATAKRIAEELHSPLGQMVGFKIRFHDTLQDTARIKLMTDGILLAEIQQDPCLRQYDTLIIDEAHERSLNIDFLLGYLKQLSSKRPELKIIITSATLDAQRFASHFGSKDGPAPVIEVSGRGYPVEIRYCPLDDKSPDLFQSILEATHELARRGQGDILIFLPGEREIRDIAEGLRQHHPPHTQILPLFARLSTQEQDRIFKPTTGARRIILATNVAETSLTVPGIRYVIDTGLARIKRYSYRYRVEQLPIEPIAQSAANQRAGRCGRVADGVCIRLYDEQDYQRRPAFTEPEILRSSLAAVILRMKTLQLGDIRTFPFLDSPSNRAIAEGINSLQELGALDEQQQLTVIGCTLARWPLDPRVARMLLAAQERACLSEALIIAAALAVQDPRERPADSQHAADLAHQRFVDKTSEFLTWLKLWDWFDDAWQYKKSHRAFAMACKKCFLSAERLRQWQEVHTQLTILVKAHDWHLNDRHTASASDEQLHMALLTGLLSQIGLKSEDGPHYFGARGLRFFLWPGSALVKKAGRWIMAAELVETTQLYARCIAQIQPIWIENVAAHLLKKTTSNPCWQRQRGQVTAHEQATLYGLVVYRQRKVDFSKRDLAVAREIFIRDALVGGDFETTAPFFAHNHGLVKTIENLEHQSRRGDVLVDDACIIAFYDQRLPADVCSQITFEKWHKEATRTQPRLLYLEKETLMRHEAAGITLDVFPKTLSIAGTDMPLSYHFEPGAVRDGVTLTVPLAALNQLCGDRCEWLVIGMLKEKVHALLKSLPQALRRHCHPLPHYSAGFLDRVLEAGHFGQANLIDALIADLREHARVIVQLSDFRPETLPAHLLMNFKVVDEAGRQLDMGRNLALLQETLGCQARAHFQRWANASLLCLAKASQIVWHNEPITDWIMDEWSECLDIARDGQTLKGFPALVDHNTHCLLDVFDDPAAAQRAHHRGVRRLFWLQLKALLKMLAKNRVQLPPMRLHGLLLGSQECLVSQILMATIERACMASPLPHNAQSFRARLEAGRSRAGLLCQEISGLVEMILAQYAPLPQKLQGIKAHTRAVADIEQQLAHLFLPRFIEDIAYAHLRHFPRYLKAIHLRIDKLRAQPARDALWQAEWQKAATPWQCTPLACPAQYCWLLEELRVALFAQELKTSMPVSVKRLEKMVKAGH